MGSSWIAALSERSEVKQIVKMSLVFGGVLEKGHGLGKSGVIDEHVVKEFRQVPETHKDLFWKAETHSGKKVRCIQRSDNFLMLGLIFI